MVGIPLAGLVVAMLVVLGVALLLFLVVFGSKRSRSTTPPTGR